MGNKVKDYKKNRPVSKMHSPLLVSAVVALLGAVAFASPRQYPLPTPDESGPYGYNKPEAQIVTLTLTEQTILTTTNVETATHQVFVTKTSDVLRTETLNTARWFTAEVTSRDFLAGAERTSTTFVKSTTQSLVVRTVTGEPQASDVVVTILSTAFVTTTAVEPTTLRVTHVDVIVTETVVPVLTVVDVDMVETLTDTVTITVQVTSTIKSYKPTRYHY